MKMSLYTLILAGALAATPALAAQCPALMAEIDAALATAELSEADLARVTELRQQGEEAHAAGNHPESEAALNEALEILGQG
ncbi:hypothetical protein [Alkalilacustris brevis]|uniref:hypothetical protein n=1 Tax=Alkalilacustris brevis TaxID=2026338 RepID=UPI001EE4A487|nr:hypothetical protein [Alkalilacustris brevis]